MDTTPPAETPCEPRTLARNGTTSRSLADLLNLLGVLRAEDAAGGASAAGVPVGFRRVAAGESLIDMGAPVLAMYFVHTGTFKIARSDRDGYEQVLAFAARGEALGFDAMCADVHPTSAIALEDATVYVVARAEVAAMRHSQPAFDQALQRAACKALTRSNDLVDIMAAVSAEVRLARFLLQVSRQMAAQGMSPRRFVLRMGRRDIASMLGVALATVSRSFTALAAAHLVEVDDRDVEILDVDALREYARSTRKAQEAPAGTCHLGLSRVVANLPHSAVPLQA